MYLCLTYTQLVWSQATYPTCRILLKSATLTVEFCYAEWAKRQIFSEIRVIMKSVDQSLGYQLGNWCYFCLFLVHITNKVLKRRKMTEYLDSLLYSYIYTYVVIPKISENLNIPRKPLAIRTCAARCVFLDLSTDSQPTGVFISACVSEFCLFSLHRFHVCLRISKLRMPRSKEFALNFASSSTKLQLK